MSEILFKLLNESCPDNDLLFRRFKNKLFTDYASGKKVIKKKDLWKPCSEITKELFNTNLDKTSFNLIYTDLDPNNKGFITKKQFNSVAKCLIMSLITYSERRSPIPGREINLCIEESELPVQMEIIDTLTDDEIVQYRRSCKKKKKKKKSSYIAIPTSSSDNNNLFIDIDSDYEDYY